MTMRLTIEIDRDEPNLWVAEIPELPGTIASAASETEAVSAVRKLAMRILTDRVVYEDAPPSVLDAVAFVHGGRVI